VDNDSILDGSSNPLGGPGTRNANYTTGQVYTIKKTPTLISPVNLGTWDPTPTLKWSTIPGATQYNYELFAGTTRLDSKFISASTCGATTCVNTPGNVLPFAVYKWRVRALTQGTWKPFSAFKSFTVLGARAGYWKGYGVDFYVTPSRTSVQNFSIYISVSGCGNYRITYPVLVPIVNGKFMFTGTFYGSGSFISATQGSGQFGLTGFYIPGCTYVSGGPYSWSATWLSPDQPDPSLASPPVLLLPGLDAPFLGPFTVDPAP
jgi:hypothetical protein